MPFFSKKEKKQKISEQELAEALFELIRGRSIDFYKENPAFETTDDFIELMILNMFLIIEFSSQEVNHQILDSISYRFWQGLMESMDFSVEDIEKLQPYQLEMWKVYKKTLDENKNENYLEMLSVRFLSHLTESEYSAYTPEALSLAVEIAENMKLIIGLTTNVKVVK